MKTILQLCLSLLFTLLFINCSEDDEMNNANYADNTVVKFGPDLEISENGGPQEIILLFSQIAKHPGQINLKITLSEDVTIQTIPEVVDGVISIKVNAGDASASFKVIPMDDDLVKGYRTIIFDLEPLSGNFRRGNNNSLKVGLKDDELYGMPRMSIVKSDTRYDSKEYFYNANKQLAAIVNIVSIDWGWIETQEFVYSDDSKIIKSLLYYGDYGIDPNANVLYETDYSWENDKIVKAEQIVDGSINGYFLFEYDDNGNLKTRLEFDRQTNGDFKLISKTTFLFNVDNNLTEETIEWYFEYETSVTKIIYNDYSEKLNYFPTNDVLPNIMLQKNLPGSLTIDEDGHVTNYTYNYEFDEEGRVIKRKQQDETITYLYN